jgi:arsenic resistance protein ArsH
MTAIMKAQIDWIPLAIGAVRSTQDKTLAIMGGREADNRCCESRRRSRRYDLTQMRAARAS